MAGSYAAAVFGRVAILFTAAFVVLIVVLALLGNFGLPGAAIGVILTGATLLTFLVAGVATRTMQMSTFYLAGRAVPPVANGMASAAAFMSGAVYLGLAGLFFADLHAAVAFTLGWSFGFLMLAVLFAPYFRKSGAQGIAGFLAARFGGPLVRPLAAVIVAVSLIAALAAAMAIAALVGTLLFDVSATAAVTTVAVLVLSATLLGGMQAVTVTGIVQYIVLALAFVLPSVFVSAGAFSVPIPPLTFGYALELAGTAANAGAGGPTGILPELFLPDAPTTAFGFFATIISLAAGVAVLPHLLMRSATVTDVDSARWSVGWSLVFVLVIALTAPAYAAFARISILADLVGSAVDALPAWVFTFGELGLVRICGADAKSVLTVSITCLETLGSVDSLAARDIAVSGDAIVLAWAGIVGLPDVLGVLIVVGALAAALAAASAIAFAVASALGHDLYGRLIAVGASAGRKLAVTRLLIVAVVVAAAWIAAERFDDAFALASAAIALSAGGLFPALLAAVWWRRANAWGAVAGMGAGFVATAALVLAHRYPDLVPLGALDPHRLGLSEISSAIVGLPVGLAALVAVSLATAPPTHRHHNILDAIRRPGGAPIVQEGES